MNTDMKRCPFCAEDIKADAKKCKHCHEILDAELQHQKRPIRTMAEREGFEPSMVFRPYALSKRAH